jgi:hypothetical protein
MTLDTAVTTMFEGFKTSIKNELTQKVNTRHLDTILDGKANTADFASVLDRLAKVEKKLAEFDTEQSDSEDELDALYDAKQEEFLIDQLENVPFPEKKEGSPENDVFTETFELSPRVLAEKAPHQSSGPLLGATGTTSISKTTGGATSTTFLPETSDDRRPGEHIQPNEQDETESLVSSNEEASGNKVMFAGMPSVSSLTSPKASDLG